MNRRQLAAYPSDPPAGSARDGQACSRNRTQGEGSRIAVVVAALLAALTLTAPAAADGPTLDELLDLGPEPAQRDEAGPRREPDTSPDATAPPGDAAPDPLDDEARRLLEREREAAADAFRQAVGEMADVAERLEARLDASVSTQRAQQAILDKLDQVIAAARRQQAGQGGGGGGGGGEGEARPRDGDTGAGDVAEQSPADGQGDGDSASAQAGAGEHGGGFSPGQVRDADADGTPFEQLQREWGNLPPRLRDEISEGLDQPYSPVYRELTEAYYRRLAEEEE
ncbi:MAG: hypothetical protein WD009_02470 [Phycisphaeraceae bacterium]